ncbi:MAG: hypothetical protein WD965_10505 [Actinomycetota bacterium]
MRRLSVRRAATPAAVGAIITVLAVMFPGLGFGQANGIHGTAPTDVFVQETPAVCSNGDPMTQELTLDEDSHLLVYFTGEWKRLGVKEAGIFWFRLDGTDTDFDWKFQGQSDWHTTGTVMWTFPDVAAGTHTVSAHAEARPVPPRPAASADVHHCAFTVFVIPVAA